MGISKDSSMWKTVKMKDIAVDNNGIVDGPFGSNLKTTDYIDDSINGVPVLTTKNLNGDFSDESVRYISKDKFDTLKRSAVFPGDILVAKIGSIGKCCIYPLDQRVALIPANLLKITLRKDYYNKYVYYYIQSSDFQALIKSITKATAQPAFNVTKFRELPISVPCYSEQIRIVQKLEESLSQLDSAVETLKKTKQQLEVYRDTVLKSAFTGSYPSKPLAEISKAISGYAFKSKLYDNSGRYRVVKIGNVKNYHFDFSRDNTRTNEFEERIIEKYLLKHGDCVITLTGSRGKRDYGFVAMINDENDYMLNQRVAALRFDISVAYPKFFMYYLSSIDYRNKFFSYETGNVGQGNVGIKALIEPEVLVPSLQEQKRIVKRIESQLSVCDCIEQTVNQSLQQAEALRQSILKKAFSYE